MRRLLFVKKLRTTGGSLCLNLNFALVDDTFNNFRSQHVRVKVAKSQWEKQGYYALRKTIFSREQKILSNNEKDDRDFRAIPIVALASSWSIGDDVVGAVRIYEEIDKQGQQVWYGGRLCVARSYRGHQSIGKALINEAVSRAIDLGCTRFLANVQPQNEKYFQTVYWRSLGQIEVAGRAHVHMIADLDKYPFMPRDPS